MTTKIKSQHAISLLGLLLFLILAVGSVDDSGSDSDSYKRTPANRHWYEGGTLHKARIRDWMRADYRNKLATCADFVAAQWQSENLKPSLQANIKTVDDIRPYAEELVTYIDVATAPEPGTNYEYAIANWRVARMATVGMKTMGWMR